MKEYAFETSFICTCPYHVLILPLASPGLPRADQYHSVRGFQCLLTLLDGPAPARSATSEGLNGHTYEQNFN